MRHLLCELPILKYSSCLTKTKFLILLWNGSLNTRQAGLHTLGQGWGHVVRIHKHCFWILNLSQIMKLMTSAHSQSRVSSHPCEGLLITGDVSHSFPAWCKLRQQRQASVLVKPIQPSGYFIASPWLGCRLRAAYYNLPLDAKHFRTKLGNMSTYTGWC